MGNQQTSPKIYNQKLQLLVNMQSYFNQKLYKKLNEQSYNIFSIINKDDEDRKRYGEILTKILNIKGKGKEKGKGQSKKLRKEEDIEINVKELGMGSVTSRSIACLLGLAICDAFGASTEFIPFVGDRRDIIQFDFNDIHTQVQCGLLQPRIGRIGIWTDDCSMALCIADSLLLNKLTFNPIHIRYLFHMWLHHGLDNGGRQHSIGLGGNIKISMEQFYHQRKQFTAEKDKFNNGNGSLMRLAPIPICFCRDQAEAMKFATLQSKTTHNGDEAADCSRLLALILVRLIKRKQGQNWKQVIEKACHDFKPFSMTQIPTVKYLAQSKQEPQQLFYQQQQKYKAKFTKFNKSPLDRNWNWKDPNFTYSKTRFSQQPGYIGSYCMDALSMALHTVWFSSSFKEVALWNANIGGDCDTVGAIAGQIAGAVYGIDAYMMHLYSQMEDCLTGRFQVFLRGYKLATRTWV